MAKAKARQRNGNRKRGSSARQWPEWSGEVAGLVLICLGILCFLSVISYTPGDLPVLGMFKSFASDSAPNTPRANLIGPVGTLLGVAQLALFGAVGYLIPIALIWFGLVKMVFNGRLWPRTVIGLAVLIVSGAVALQGIGVWFADWARQINITGPGGLVGFGLGDHVIQPLLGRTGTVLVAGCVYLVALVLLTGMPPIRFAKEVAAMTSRGMSNLWTWWRERGKQPAPVPKAARKRANRKKEPETGEAVEEQQLLPLRETPPPQIIDAAQRKNQHPEPGDKPFERNKPAYQGLSTNGFEDYELPGFDLLDEEEKNDDAKADESLLLATQQTIVETLKSFGIEVAPGNITHGPTITRYEIYPNVGLRVSRIAQLEADLARATKAERINILAPIPGKDTVGIELANSQKISVPLHELLKDPEFRSAKKRIPLVLGKDVYGKTVIGDLAAMPHLLIAGATGSGKSVCVNAIITSILFKFSPDELRFIMVDPKVVEMQMYNKLPHLIVPVVTDPHKVVPALKWVVDEMERRYKIFAKAGVRNFEVFNKRPRPEKEKPAATPEPEPEADLARIEEIASELEAGALEEEESANSKPVPRKFSEAFIRKMEGEGVDEDDLTPAQLGLPELPEAEDEMPDNFPYIVVIIDELADLMQTAPADVEMCIARIAQKARAAGIHLIIATQTPRADVVTGIIKANIPCRIAFQVSSQLDSRVILDVKGAEKLVGKGDMLYLPPGSAKHERSQGAFVSDEEVERIVDYCAEQGEPQFEESIQASIENSASGGEDDVSDADEETLLRCIEVIRQEQKASTSLLQRRLRLGYTRAARMVDILEQRGLVGPGDGAKAREVFLPPEE